MTHRLTSPAIGIVLMVMAVGACATTTPTTGPGGTPAPSSEGSDQSRFFSIEEVGIGPDGYVTLRNYTDVAANLDRVLLCQPPSCVDLPDVVVEPGRLARIAVGSGSGLEDVVMTQAALTLAAVNGEVAVYGQDQQGDPGEIRAYLEWGSTPHEATADAVKAGLWREGSYAPSGPDAIRLWRRDGGWWVWDAAQ